MPGVPRARVSQMRRGRVSAVSLWGDEHLVDRVEARRARVGLCEQDCGVSDVLRRVHGAPIFHVNGCHQQGRLGRAEERWSAFVVASAERHVRGGGCAGGRGDVRGLRKSSCAERDGRSRNGRRRTACVSRDRRAPATSASSRPASCARALYPQHRCQQGRPW
jgi:hypothetical protein